MGEKEGRRGASFGLGARMSKNRETEGHTQNSKHTPQGREG